MVLPRIIESLNFTVWPIIFGIVVGMLLGILSVKIRYKFVKIIFQIMIILGISVPVFYIGLSSQLVLGHMWELFPTTHDPVLPGIDLFMITAVLMTRQFRSNFVDVKERHYLPSNVLRMCFNINLIFAASLVLEAVFNLNGLGNILFTSIYNQDYYVFRTTISIMLFLILIPVLVSTLSFTLYSFLIEDIKWKGIVNFTELNEKYWDEDNRNESSFGKDLKDFLIRRLKSPFTVIGLVIVGFAIIISIFPMILTPLSYEQLSTPIPGAWDPPSPEHPLGQSFMGRDVLALVVYGIKIALVMGILSVLIGILGGLIFGFLSRFHRLIKAVILALLTLIFSLPIIVLLISLIEIIGIDTLMFVALMGLFLIPGFTILFGRGEFDLKSLIKKVITYIPLFMGFSILFIEALYFLGPIDPILFFHLGTSVSYARSHIVNSPWASLWPAFSLFILCIGFFALYYGLKEPILFNFKRKKE